MKIGLGMSIIGGSMLLVIVMALTSRYVDQNFWPDQVLGRWKRAGIAFFAHGGMWGDFFLLPLLFAFIITRYGASWSVEQILIMAGIGIAVTLGNHLLLIFTQNIPDPLGWKEEKWSATIALHFVYMSTYVALAGLFYFSPGVSAKAAVVVSAMLGIHMIFGTHIPLGILNLWKNWVWCPDFLSSPVLPFLQLAIWVTLSALAWYAAGWRAGVSVIAIAIALASLVVLIVWLSIITEVAQDW